MIFFTLLPDPANWPGSLTHVGEPVPEFSVTTLDGEQVSSSELRGKVVLLGFFATWCGPCRHELPHLQKIWEDFGHRHDFAMIVVGRGETKDKLVDFQSKQKLTLPLAPDPQQLVYGKFATKAIPRTYPISRDGTIIYQCTGYEEEYVADLRLRGRSGTLETVAGVSGGRRSGPIGSAFSEHGDQTSYTATGTFLQG